MKESPKGTRPKRILSSSDAVRARKEETAEAKYNETSQLDEAEELFRFLHTHTDHCLLQPLRDLGLNKRLDLLPRHL